MTYCISKDDLQISKTSICMKLKCRFVESFSTLHDEIKDPTSRKMTLKRFLYKY